MLLGLSFPQLTDYQYLTVPKSSQMVCTVMNRIVWNAGDDSGPLDSGTQATGWRSMMAGYAKTSLLIPVLVGTGTNGSGQVTSPLDSSGAANPTLMTLAAVAAGTWDTLYTTCFTNIATYYPNTVLRIGNEWFGSSWYPWNGPSQGYAGKAAYQHLVTLARSINSNFKFEWLGCLDLSDAGGYSYTDVQNFYPGDTYVDYLSADVYDVATLGKVGQAMWDLDVLRMSQCLQFAQAHGKPYCITEWGLQNVAQTGVGNNDDPAYIQAAYHWMRTNQASLGWTTFFNPLSWDGRLQNNPQSEAMFKALFVPWARELAGETTHRFVTPGYGQIGGISAVGAFTHGRANALKTLAVAPQAVGNVLVLAALINAFGAGSVASISGGGVTTWTRMAQSNVGTLEGDTELWYGVVTSTGPSTLTLTSAHTNVATLGCQEFTIGTPATWAVDVTATSTATTQAASGNYPSVTPTGVLELYVGAALMGGGAVGGSGAGFTRYQGGLTFEPNSQYVFNPVASNPTAQSPAWTQTSGYWSAASALLTATPATAGKGAHRLRLA